MKTILVPIDYSANSDSACKYAIELAKSTNSKIILMHAFEISVLYSELPLMTVQLDYSYLFNNAAKKLRAYAKKIHKFFGNTEVELSIQVGLPSARIVELATEKKVDLIVMGTTGKGTVERILIGSNTTRTLRNAPCMVLAIPPKTAFKGFRKIVYATDLSKGSLEQAHKLIEFGNKFKSELVILNIGDENLNTNDLLKKLNRKINDIVHYSKIKGFVTTDNNIPRAIEYFLKYHKASCLAIYTRHRNLISRLFNKSIASELALHTKIPLLIIHEDDHDLIENPVIKTKNHLTSMAN